MRHCPIRRPHKILLRPQRRSHVFGSRRCPAPDDAARHRSFPPQLAASPETENSAAERLRELLTQATNVLRSQVELIRRYDPCVPLPSTALRGLGVILQNVEGMLIEAYILYDEQ